MKILLDIDDTALIYNKSQKEYLEHPRLDELLDNNEVILYSGNSDIAEYYKKWRVKGFIAKSSDSTPTADILIDNDAELWIDLVSVKKFYKSIDEFFENE